MGLNLVSTSINILVPVGPKRRLEGGWIGARSLFANIRFNTNVTPIAMEAMKINIPVQRKTSIESNREPRIKSSKQQTQKPEAGLTAPPGGLTDGQRSDRWNRRSDRWRTETKHCSENSPWTRPKIDLTFDSQGKTSRNLNHTFLGLLGTYSNQRLQQLKPGFLSISDWTKKGQKLGQNEESILQLARGWLMITKTLDGFPHVTAS